jgi:hypothetical protein
MKEFTENYNPNLATEQQIAGGFMMAQLVLQETVANPFNLHQEIVNRTVDVEVLAKSDRNIGSLKIDTIDDMAVVPMGNRVGIEADFNNIDTLETATSRNFEAFKQKIATSIDYEKLRNRLIRLTPEQQELELQVFFATGLAVEYFCRDDNGRFTDEEVAEKKMRRDQTYLDNYTIDTSREDSLSIKPLSEAGKDAMCTEYALFVKEALRRLGTKFSYVAAEKQGWPDQPSFYHSFLVSADGKTLVDPLDTAQFFSRGLSYGVNELSESFYESKEPVVATGSWNNNTKIYSLTHVEAPVNQVA